MRGVVVYHGIWRVGVCYSTWPVSFVVLIMFVQARPAEKDLQRGPLPALPPLPPLLPLPPLPPLAVVASSHDASAAQPQVAEAEAAAALSQVTLEQEVPPQDRVKPQAAAEVPGQAEPGPETSQATTLQFGGLSQPQPEEQEEDEHEEGYVPTEMLETEDEAQEVARARSVCHMPALRFRMLRAIIVRCMRAQHCRTAEYNASVT